MYATPVTVRPLGIAPGSERSCFYDWTLCTCQPAENKPDIARLSAGKSFWASLINPTGA